MRQDIFCAFCKRVGDGSGVGYYNTAFLLAVRPNSRTLPKGWACRGCLSDRADMDNRDFLKAFDKAIRRKK